MSSEYTQKALHHQCPTTKCFAAVAAVKSDQKVLEYTATAVLYNNSGDIQKKKSRHIAE